MGLVPVVERGEVKIALAEEVDLSADFQRKKGNKEENLGGLQSDDGLGRFDD